MNEKSGALRCRYKTLTSSKSLRSTSYTSRSAGAAVRGIQWPPRSAEGAGARNSEQRGASSSANPKMHPPGIGRFFY